MAKKLVAYCDDCQSQEDETNQILPTFFTPEGKEVCFSCALLELRTMYGLPNGTLVPAEPPPTNGTPKTELSNETAAFDKRRSELATEHGTEIHLLKPKVPVKPGDQIVHGTPERNIEIIEKFKDNLWFCKLIAH